VIEEISATTLLYPGDVARADRYGSLLVTVRSQSRGAVK